MGQPPSTTRMPMFRQRNAKNLFDKNPIDFRLRKIVRKEGSCDLECERARSVFITMRALEDYALVKLIARCGDAAARTGFELHVNRKHPGLFRAAIPAGQGRRSSRLRKWISNQGRRRGTNRHNYCRGIRLRPQSCGQAIASASRSVPSWRTASGRSSPAA